MSDPNVQITQPSAGGGGGSAMGEISAGLNIVNGLKRGGIMGDAGAAVAAGSLANQAGLTNIPGIGPAGQVLGLINGIKQGGVTGYTGAAMNGLQLANEAGLVGGSAASIIGPVGAALGTYNFIKNWQSGATGSDALNGAEAGAGIGTMVLPGIGTAVGAIIGGAVGAASSMFGGGKVDKETTNWDTYAQNFSQKGVAGVIGASPSQSYQMLAGIFDAKGGSNIPFFNKYGRMGEGQFMQGMTSTINSAVSSGKVAKDATPQEIYSKVVQPWITSMGGSKGWQSTSTSTGYAEKPAIDNLLTNMVAQYMLGDQSGWTGINGQSSPVSAKYAGTPTQAGMLQFANSQAEAAQQGEQQWTMMQTAAHSTATTRGGAVKSKF